MAEQRLMVTLIDVLNTSVSLHSHECEVLPREGECLTIKIEGKASYWKVEKISHNLSVHGQRGPFPGTDIHSIEVYVSNAFVPPWDQWKDFQLKAKKLSELLQSGE